MRSARRLLAASAASLLAAGVMLARGPGDASSKTMSDVLPAPVAATLAPPAPFTARMSVTTAGRQLVEGGAA
jgi:hypothetical protein